MVQQLGCHRQSLPSYGTATGMSQTKSALIWYSNCNVTKSPLIWYSNWDVTGKVSPHMVQQLGCHRQSLPSYGTATVMSQSLPSFGTATGMSQAKSPLIWYSNWGVTGKDSLHMVQQLGCHRQSLPSYGTATVMSQSLPSYGTAPFQAGVRF